MTDLGERVASGDGAVLPTSPTASPRRDAVAGPGLLLATAGGLALAAWSFHGIGLDDTLAIARRLGIDGFAIYIGWSLAVFALLGGAWHAVARQPASRWALFTGARLVREAASDLLPFSQIGGIVLGLRVLTARSIAAPLALASFAADLTTEMLSQLLFTAIGLALGGQALAGIGRSGWLLPALATSGVLALVVVGALRSAPRWLMPLGRSLLGRFAPAGEGMVAGTSAELSRLFAQRRAMTASFVLNLAAWVTSAAGAWIALRWMDIPFPVARVLALESLIFALRGAAFMVPAGIGVQEAGYALLAPLLGLPPEAALALALAKRVRDLAIGLPTLVAWQLLETRALASRR